MPPPSVKQRGIGQPKVVTQEWEILQDNPSWLIVANRLLGGNGTDDAGISNVGPGALEGAADMGAGGDEGDAAEIRAGFEVGGKRLRLAVGAVVVAGDDFDFVGGDVRLGCG